MKKYILILLLGCVVRLQAEESSPIPPVITPPVITTAAAWQYWWDSDIAHRQQISTLSGTYVLDASSLTDGMHTLFVQVINHLGVPSFVRSACVLKLTPTTNTRIAGLQFWFNGDLTTMQTVNYNGGLIELDASALPNGMHTIHTQVVHADGSVGSIQTAVFLVMQSVRLQERYITHVRYWFNEDSQNHIDVPVETPIKDFVWTSYISCPKVPIRSTNFRFAIEDEVPVIYAENTIHFWAKDNAEVSTHGSCNFMDYNNRKVVQNIDSLLEKQTFTTPEKDSIRWFYVDAKVGDSLTLYTSVAATIQFFAPSGKEIYHASGYTSTRSDAGCHTMEKGRHYIAVHDITATKRNATLYSNHIDRYAVFGQDVTILGNGGFSTINYTGNGFDYLKGVDLVSNNGDTIPVVQIGHESNTQASIIYDCENARTGTYSTIFHFEEEDLIRKESVNILEATPVRLDIRCAKASHKGKVLVGNPAIYTITITNHGNMTAYQVPLYLCVTTMHRAGIESIDMKGLQLPTLLSEVDMSGYTDAEKIWARSFESRHGDMHYFDGFANYSESARDTAFGYTSYFPIDIPPLSTRTINIQVKSSRDLDAWVTIPTAVDPVHGDMSGHSLRDMYCCYADRISNTLGFISDVTSIASDYIEGPPMAIADCAAGVASDISSVTQDALCGGKSGSGIGFLNAMSKSTTSIGKTLLGCAGNLLPASSFQRLCHAMDDELNDPVEKIRNLIQHGADLYKSYTTPTPGCYTGKTVNGGERRFVKSFDPNEIYGYLSEAGSHYMTAEVESLNYTIEFENDTALATAAAQTIVVIDTLDGSKFDLTSFRPTRIQIGSHSEEINEESANFVRTIDMRPAIHAIAEVACHYDAAKGIARWTFSSLDPITMEAVEDVEQGILPVNVDGKSGVGEVEFEIRLRQAFAEGTTISNQANIIFDSNAPIRTPIWTNTIDATRPHSHINNILQQGDSTLTIAVSGSDNMSGIWKYEIYGRREEDSNLEFIGECLADSVFTCLQDSNIVAYLSLAIDSAGNREAHEFYELRLLINNANMGLVTGAGLYQAGEQVTIEAIPESGYYFSHWSDYDTGNPRTIWINDDTELTAYFVLSTATEVKNTDSSAADVVKYIENEKLYIRYAGHVYSILGTSIKNAPTP